MQPQRLRFRVSHSNGPLRKQRLSSAGSKEFGLLVVQLNLYHKCHLGADESGLFGDFAVHDGEVGV